MEADPNLLANYLNSNYPWASFEIAYEAGFSGFWLQRKLEQMNFNCIVLNASDIPQTNKGALNKTDKIDSRRIALALRTRQISGIYIPTEEQEDDRLILRQRAQVVRNMVRAKNVIKSLLYYKGIRMPQRFTSSNSKKFSTWIKSLQHNDESTRIALDQKIKHLEFLRTELLEITKYIRTLMRSEKYRQSSELLRSIPGIGNINCFAFLTEIGDIKRFVTTQGKSYQYSLIPEKHSSVV